MVPLVWLPVTYYLFTRCLAGGFSIPMSLIFLFIGIIWWTFTEYVMHRFLFHLEPFKNKGSYLSKVTDNWTYITIHFLFHGQHHKVSLIAIIFSYSDLLRKIQSAFLKGYFISVRSVLVYRRLSFGLFFHSRDLRNDSNQSNHKIVNLFQELCDLIGHYLLLRHSYDA
jgi:hypothetical protein